MTGGQPVDGVLTVPQITRLVSAEGARRVVVVSDDPDRVTRAAARDPLGPGVTVHHRDDLDAVQRDLRETAGVTVLVYDQTCATEARRRRKRGKASPRRGARSSTRWSARGAAIASGNRTASRWCRSRPSSA